jgi:hypothetical protein
MENKQTEKIIYIENKNITAVQWLIRQQKHNKFFDIETIEQAKQMEKEQIKDAYSNGVVRHLHNKTILSEEYYNKTYGK